MVRHETPSLLYARTYLLRGDAVNRLTLHPEKQIYRVESARLVEPLVYAVGESGKTIADFNQSYSMLFLRRDLEDAFVLSVSYHSQ